MYRHYNPNPLKKNVSDCAVRAVSKAMGFSWNEAYIAIAIQGLIDADMPHANNIWGKYLENHGFVKRIIQSDVSVSEFAEAHPYGTYVLALSGHVVCVKDGSLFDSWDSGNEIILYYWEKE